MEFRVSVVIPVYNAGPFIRQAVESALAQTETAEVVLVEDKSPDDSLAVCQQLAHEFPQVRLFRHPGGVNRGAGPSRNLGITNSTFPYIAFLDADDFYLPSRFTVVQQVFKEHPECDGVYEAVGMHFEDEEGKSRWLESDMAGIRMTTMEAGIPPEELYAALTRGGHGHIHLNSLVIRRTVLDRSGNFNENIPNTRGEDTDFILRLSAVGQLFPGSVMEPTSMRRVHAGNRVSARRSVESIEHEKLNLCKATYAWVRVHGTPVQLDLAFRRLIQQWLSFPAVGSNCQKLLRLVAFPFHYPAAFGERAFWREGWETFKALIRSDWLRLP